MENNFDLKKFLVENKLTINSKLLSENNTPRYPEGKLSVEDKIKGVSSGCADVFGAETDGRDLISENQVPGTSGLPSFVKLQNEGYKVITF